MSNIRKKTIAGLKRGDTFTASCTFTEHDATAFADVGRDYSPVHFDLPFAKAMASDILCFASFTMCATINLAMSALIFTGGLQAVLPGELAVRGEPGSQCTVCKSCKALVCKVLA